MGENINYEKLKIKEYKLWTLYLNEYQCYLGRVYLVANRKDAKDFIETTREEREEFFYIAEEVNIALKKLFEPDLMNYASLGNTFRHLHVHFIPRYKGERTFDGTKFEDTRWGLNYEPYDREFKLTTESLNLIKHALSSTLK